MHRWLFEVASRDEGTLQGHFRVFCCLARWGNPLPVRHPISFFFFFWNLYLLYLSTNEPEKEAKKKKKDVGKKLREITAPTIIIFLKLQHPPCLKPPVPSETTIIFGRRNRIDSQSRFLKILSFCKWVGFAQAELVSGSYPFDMFLYCLHSTAVVVSGT